MVDKAPTGQDLYVGYLPVPARLRRFLVVLVATGLCAIVATGVLIARTQPASGAGVWESTARVFTGVLHARPYPMLYADDRGDGQPGFLLLVEEGKRGAYRAAALDGRRATIRGRLLHRDARKMVELEPADTAIGPADRGASSSPDAVSLGPVTLLGEIVDSKCFLGAMKPGSGRTHKECATLCIRGGIPPMLATWNERGQVTCYLLASASGGPVAESLHAFVGEPVEVTGNLERRGDLLVLRTDARGVRRP